MPEGLGPGFVYLDVRADVFVTLMGVILYSLQ